jgi:outer membrane protein
MNVRTGLVILCLAVVSESKAQQSWDLKQCIDYAFAHNITVRQADLQTKFSQLNLQQTKWARYPNASFSTNAGYSSGRNQDPTTFSLITTGYFFNNYSLQASVDLFNWFAKKDNVQANALQVQASEAGFEKAKNDVALNIAVGYLQVLLAREQINQARDKLSLTSSQLESTRKQVDAGRLPELNAANLESQQATDSATLIGAETNAQELMLQLKTLLNLDPAAPFDIASPPVDKIPIESLADLQPEAVYDLAVKNMPQQKADVLKVQSAIKSVAVARANMHPDISLFGSLGSTFNSQAKEIRSSTVLNSPVGTVNVGGTSYQVYPLTPFSTYTYGNIGYTDQLNQNFRQSIGLNISVPIFSGGNLRTAWLRSKLNVTQAELNKEQNSFSLKQDIYKAYHDAVAAAEKFHAGKKTVETSQKAYTYAAKRYELGLLSSYDLITTENNLQQARSQLLLNQYDYVFKMKLLEFYKGQGLKL